MSFNGSGTFVINSSGQPVVANTVISSTVFNALTADLATGLSTCITKDGQTTPTANIPMGTFKFTNLGVGSAATDSATLGQVQASTTKLVTVTGTDAITGTMIPALTAYASGQMFYFVAGGANTGAVTLNIDGLGARNVTRHGSVALVAGDILSGEVCVVVYDGTRFQLLNPASYTNLNVTGVLALAAGTALLPSLAFSGDLNTGLWSPAADTLAASTGGSERLRVDSSGNLGIGTASPSTRLQVNDTNGNLQYSAQTAGFGDLSYVGGSGNVLRVGPTGHASGGIALMYTTGGAVRTEGMRLDASGNVGIGTASPLTRFDVNKTTSQAPGGTTPNGALVIKNTAAGAGCVEIGSDTPVLGYLQVRNTANQTYYDFALQPNGGNVGIGTASPTAKLHVVGNQYRQTDATASFGFVINTTAATTRLETLFGGSSFAVRTNGDTTDAMTIDSNRNIVAGASAALATNATNGFLYVPTCAGTPTGTPTAITGMAPIVVNTTNNKLYFYSGGAWRDAGP